MNDLKVCWWPIDKPIPYARNSRKIPERAIDKVAASIKEFGWRAEQSSLTKTASSSAAIPGCWRPGSWESSRFPFTPRNNLTPAQVEPHRLVDNHSHEETDWRLRNIDGCDFMFRQYTEDIFLQSV